MTRDLRDARNFTAIKTVGESGLVMVVYTINDAARTVDVTRIAHRHEVYE